MESMQPYFSSGNRIYFCTNYLHFSFLGEWLLKSIHLSAIIPSYESFIKLLVIPIMISNYVLAIAWQLQETNYGRKWANYSYEGLVNDFFSEQRLNLFKKIQGETWVMVFSPLFTEVVQNVSNTDRQVFISWRYVLSRSLIINHV